MFIIFSSLLLLWPVGYVSSGEYTWVRLQLERRKYFNAPVRSERVFTEGRADE